MSVAEVLLSSRGPVFADVFHECQNNEAGKERHHGVILDTVEKAAQSNNREPLLW